MTEEHWKSNNRCDGSGVNMETDLTSRLIIRTTTATINIVSHARWTMNGSKNATLEKNTTNVHNTVHDDIIWRQLIKYEMDTAEQWDNKWGFMTIDETEKQVRIGQSDNELISHLISFRQPRRESPPRQQWQPHPHSANQDFPSSLQNPILMKMWSCTTSNPTKSRNCKFSTVHQPKNTHFHPPATKSWGGGPYKPARTPPKNPHFATSSSDVGLADKETYTDGGVVQMNRYLSK